MSQKSHCFSCHMNTCICHILISDCSKGIEPLANKDDFKIRDIENLTKPVANPSDREVLDAVKDILQDIDFKQVTLTGDLFRSIPINEINPDETTKTITVGDFFNSESLKLEMDKGIHIKSVRSEIDEMVNNLRKGKILVVNNTQNFERQLKEFEDYKEKVESVGMLKPLGPMNLPHIELERPYGIAIDHAHPDHKDYTTITVTIHNDIYKTLAVVGNNSYTSIADLITDAVEKYLENIKKNEEELNK